MLFAIDVASLEGALNVGYSNSWHMRTRCRGVPVMSGLAASMGPGLRREHMCMRAHFHAGVSMWHQLSEMTERVSLSLSLSLSLSGADALAMRLMNALRAVDRFAAYCRRSDDVRRDSGWQALDASAMRCRQALDVSPGRQALDASAMRLVPSKAHFGSSAIASHKRPASSLHSYKCRVAAGHVRTHGGIGDALQECRR